MTSGHRANGGGRPMTPDRLSGAGTASLALSERVAGRAFLACAVLAGLSGAAVVAVLARESALFFSQVSPVRFLTEHGWTPGAEEPRYGILPLLAATGQIVAGAALVAFPLGLLTAIHLRYHASERTAPVLAAALAFLAAVPTVVYGYVALNFVTPALRRVWPGIEAFNGLSACLVVGVMILPTVALLSRGALGAVPQSLTEAGTALGATRARVITRVAIPAAWPGIAAAMALAIARVAGETMIVTLAAGNQARLTWNPLEGVRTLTAFIAQARLGDTPPGTIEYHALVTVAAVLFACTYAVHAVARRLARGAGPAAVGAPARGRQPRGARP